MNPNKQEFDQKQLFYAVAASALVLVFWQSYFAPPPPTAPPAKPDSGQVAAQPQTPKPQALPQRPEQEGPAASFEVKTLATLENSKRQRLSFGSDGAIESWTLLEEQYHTRNGEGSSPERFVHPMKGDEHKGFFLPPILELQLAGKLNQSEYKGSAQGQTVALHSQDPSGVQISKRFSLDPENYVIKLDLELKNSNAQAIPYDLSALLRGAENEEESSGGFMFMPPIHLFEGVCKRVEDFEREQSQAIRDNMRDPEEPTHFNDGIVWAGVNNRYFMTALIPVEGEAESCEFFFGLEHARLSKSPPGFNLISTRLELKGGEIPAGGSVKRSFQFYAGPKKLDRLRALQPKIDDAIDFGYFAVICEPMLWMMRTFYGFSGNWGIAIILLTLLVKLLTFPLTHKQYKSMAGMKLIQPEMKALQEKHKEDKAKQQQEMMALYKAHGVNPLAGCLPLVLMMPIYFALYRTIYSAVELYQARFFFWIDDLSKMDPYYITPLLLGVLMVIQTRLNPSSGDAMQQKMMMWFMPIMFTGMMLFLPSGLVLYIAVNTVLGIIQQYVLMKKASPAAA